MKKLKLLTWLFVFTYVAACSGSSDRGFKETESGIKYKFHVRSGDEIAELGSILSMDLSYRLKDSVLFDSKLSGMPMYLELQEPQYPGDIYEGLAMMAVGDSATFILDAAQFLTMTVGMPQLPDFVTEGDKFYFDVKLQKAMNEDEFMEEQQRMMEERMQADMSRADDEDDLLKQYLSDQNIDVVPTESGLYYVEREKGDGPAAESGKTVRVHYEGKLLDGTVFDSSITRGEPLEFVVGVGQVIPGWDEGISMMNQGGKATLVIPSYLGYGERGAGQTILPYSTLVFEVELVEVK